MSGRLISLVTFALIAGILGAGIYGVLTFTAFNQWRNAAVLREAFEKTKKRPDRAAALDQFFLGPEVDPNLKGLYKPVPELKEQYKAARDSKEVEDLNGFFAQHLLPSRWIPWLCVIGMGIAIPLLLAGFRSLFQNQVRSMVLIMAVVGGLGGYFYFLAGNSIYPLGIDLAGGTELIYMLDYGDIDRRISSVIKRKEEAEIQKGQKDSKGDLIDEEYIRRKYTNVQAALTESKKAAPEKATEVVRKRVDPTGTIGIPITLFGSDRIRIQLPKASPEDVERIKRAIRTQGRLTFHIVSDDQKVISEIQKSPNKESAEFELMEVVKKDRYNPDKVIPDHEKEKVVIEKLPRMEGSRVIFAGSTRSEKGGYEIRLQFDPQGAAEFEELTRLNVKKRMAIVLDRVCYSAPVIQERIAGECRISGSFTQKDADELAGILTAGSLPAEVKLESEFVVGPSLGGEQIESGVTATVIGTGLLSTFLLVYYRIGGLIAVLCITLNLIMLVGALGFFKATMTLPGIAGIALNLGMAVDANVLILERLREELARGRNLRQAVQLGFDRAFLTVVDSNLTVMISGIILYYLGTGPVRGFAVTLVVGIILSFFTNLWVTRIFTEWLVQKEVVQSFKMMQLFPPTNYDFMGKRRPWIAVSILLILATLVSFTYQGILKHDIYDVDFTGGTLVQFNFKKGSEQSQGEIDASVKEKLMPQFTERVKGVAESLERLAKSPKTGPELRQEVYAALPEFGHTLFGSAQAVTAESLATQAEGVRKSLEDLDKSDLVVQSFGVPTEKGAYRSYTLTTRLNNQAVIEALLSELIKTYSGKLEPRAVEIVGETVRVRLKELEPSKIEAEGAALQAALKIELQRLAIAKENAELKPHLDALKVSSLESREKDEGGHPFFVLSPLPKDASDRQELATLLEEVKVKSNNTVYRAEGMISRKSAFGPQVAKELGTTAMLALLASLVGIFIYMWFRFEFSGAWGFGAIVALLHDATIAVGGLCLVNGTGWMPVLIDLNVVAAVLTIIGYSVNDTIVIFDRIREVKRAHPTRGLVVIINEAVNISLSRTFLTFTLTMLTVIALLLFGGPTIRGLAFTLFVGMIAGVYSTVFIASPLMMWWYQRYGEGRAPIPGQQRAVAEELPPAKAQI